MIDRAASVGHSYDRLFYEYQRAGSLRSALALLPWIVDALRPATVLDVGCGAGAWLAAYRRLGVYDVVGVDGDYVDRELLLIDGSAFAPRDISRHFDLGREFDLVQCLEVAEHVPSSASGVLVDNIVRHGKIVLFSAAVPGQGGEDHINEQTYEYWRDQFAQRGYRLFDFVRPLVANDSSIESWYRYNVLVFAADSIVGSLPQRVVDTRVSDEAAVCDYSPRTYRLRKAAIRMLPSRIVSWLAVCKHKYAVTKAGR